MYVYMLCTARIYAEIECIGTSARSIYYVLGQQNGPPGKFPPGWDITLRGLLQRFVNVDCYFPWLLPVPTLFEGMVVGETRRITLPFSLAYDMKGDKDRGIPPFATMIYTVRLLSLT